MNGHYDKQQTNGEGLLTYVFLSIAAYVLSVGVLAAVMGLVEAAYR